MTTTHRCQPLVVTSRSLTMTSHSLNHNKLLPILSWDDNEKGKEKEKLTWNADQVSWNDIEHNELSPILFWNAKEKDCGKKLSSMGVWVTPDEDYWMQTHYYYKPCHCKHYGYSKRQGNKQLLDEEIWNDISSRRETYNTSCQYTILISNCVSYDMSITAVWHCVISCLDSYPHDKNKIWHMANAKIKGTMSSKILEIKNNLPKPVNVIFIPNSDAFLDIKTGPEEFYEHYQNLVLTKEE
ncbi:hypothetical protein G9A89_023631 [Geosiphon pyriformis]|nr:hypothetical protein G9A89_023631 [Geosiphon pyriformis]